MKKSLVVWVIAALFVSFAPACRKKQPSGAQPAEPSVPAAQTEKASGAEQPAAPALKADRGVDVAAKTIRIGALNDESGPGAAIGKPFAIGKRILARQVNAGAGGILPDGWKVALIEKDHGYNPQKAVEAYREIQDQVLFVGTSFGTPNTLPLRPFLERDDVMAFPASLSSELASHAHTPPLGPSYKVEAMRAMDWVVQQAGGAAGVKAGVVYQQDDYGQDGLDGWKAAARHHGVAIVGEQTVTPGQKDMAAVVTALKDAGATHVLLVTLPSATGPILGTAAQLQFAPIWIGNTAAWIDGFFSPSVIPSAVFANYHQMSGLPFWGEEAPGMDKFLDAYERFGKDLGPPDFYTLASYIQGLTQLEAARRAIESGDVTRAGYRTSMQSMKDWTAGGLIQPIDLTSLPYVTSTWTRVLKPDFEKPGWRQVADWAVPAALH